MNNGVTEIEHRSNQEMFINKKNHKTLQTVRLRKSLLGALILGIMLIGQTQSASANFSTTVTVTNGSYGDYDSLVGEETDGFEDDIMLNMSLEIENKRYSTPVDLYFAVILPSGSEFWFVANLIVYKTSDHAIFDLAIVILEIATESGWYTAKAVGFAVNEQFSNMHTLVFDPPGSGSGMPPTAYFI